MSKKDENNSQIMIKNNSIQNINNNFNQKNKSNNILTDSPSTQFTVQIHSLNSNQHTKDKENKKNVNNKSRNKENDFVKYVNNDKYKIKRNFIYMTHNYSKSILLSTPNIKKNNKNNYNNINNSPYKQKNNRNSLTEKKINFSKQIKKKERSNNNIKNNNIEEKKIIDNLIYKNGLIPEELHFFYVKIIQSGREISKKFEGD